MVSFMKQLFLFAACLICTTAIHGQVKPKFENGAAVMINEFKDSANWIRHDLWVETTFDTDGDGKLDRMHVDVCRPKQTETEGLKLPVVYASSPYYAGTANGEPGEFWDVKQELGAKSKPHAHPEVVSKATRPIISESEVKLWLPYGYIVVHSSSPGTGFSQGAPTVGGDNESLAPMAVIEWLTGKDNGYTSPDGNEKIKAYWSTGKVGMTGTSYNGTLPIAAATTGVKGLEAIIPIAPNTSYYHYYRSNGLVRSPGGYLGEDIDVLYDFIHSGDVSKRAYNNKTVRDTEMAAGLDRQTGDYNDFWAGRDYLNDMKPFKAALFMSHGFNDWNVMPEHSYRIYKKAKEMGVPSMIFYHQLGHGGAPPFSMFDGWFTRYLHGIENGVEQDQRAWIVRENDDRLKPTPYADYPNPKAEDVTLYLEAGAPGAGQLSTQAKKSNKTKEKIIDNYSFSGATLAQAEFTDHRLLYLTPILKAPLHLSGLASIKIKLASNKPAANLSVWLVSLPWNDSRNAKITDNIITRGWADPQNHASIRKGEPLTPGKFYEVSFDLQPDDQIIPEGQQIGLLIFSSDREFTLLPKPGTELTVDLGGTILKLPVVGGQKAFDAAIK